MRGTSCSVVGRIFERRRRRRRHRSSLSSSSKLDSYEERAKTDPYKRDDIPIIHHHYVNLYSRGKKSKSVFDFLIYSRETVFSFFYEKVGNLHRLNVASDEIDWVSKFDNFLSFGANQNALQHIFFA